MDDEILSSPTEYNYAPLQGLHSVRLLTLHPAASYGTPIHISLREVSLDVSVEFAALSYTWTTEGGDCSLSKQVECDGAIIKITANCEAALRRIRQVEKSFDFWIDAICINQSDDDEKSLQVPQMRQIYKKALWVALWIGEASCTLDEETSRPITDLGMEFLHNFAIELQGSKDSGQNPRDGTLYQEVVRGAKSILASRCCCILPVSSRTMGDPTSALVETVMGSAGGFPRTIGCSLMWKSIGDI